MKSKDILINLVLALFIMSILTNVVYFMIVLIFKIPLSPLIYPIASITAFCTICSSYWFKIVLGEYNKSTKIFYFFLLMIILPLIDVFSITHLSNQFNFTGIQNINIVEGLFGWFFGDCAAIGIKLIEPVTKSLFPRKAKFNS